MNYKPFELSHKEFKKLLMAQHARLEDDIFICAVSEFCEGIENLTKECKTYRKASLGFIENRDGLLLTNKGDYKIAEWHYHVGTPLTALQSIRIQCNIKKSRLIIDLKNFKPEEFRDYLIGNILAKRLFSESLDNQLCEKSNIKKIKI